MGTSRPRDHQLLTECMTLLIQVSEHRYGCTLLEKVKKFLILCLCYKANRNSQRPRSYGGAVVPPRPTQSSEKQKAATDSQPVTAQIQLPETPRNTNYPGT